MTARFVVADVFDGLASIPDGSVDLVVTSPPFLALRSYLPADHPDKGKEIGSEATPAEFIDVMLRVTQELRRVLAPHGSICVELGDTYAGSGGGGGDYLDGGMREGQQQFAGSAASMKESNAAHWRQKNQNPSGWPLAKSRALIPQLYEIALAYGVNPLTGVESPAGRWRIRNVVTWARPNPPVGALGDKWRPATSDLIVACTSPKRYWDDLATRKEHKRDYELEAAADSIRFDRRHRMQEQNGLSAHPSPSSGMPNGGGAPLLDYWVIPPGGYSGQVATEWQRPVSRGEPVDGICRTTSSDCPEHGDRPDSAPTGSHGELRREVDPTHNPDTGSRPVQGQLVDSVPTDQSGEHSIAPSSSDSPNQEHSPVASDRSKASSRKVRAPGTIPPDTPFEEKARRTDDTPASPLSGEHRPDTSENTLSASGSVGSPKSRTSVRTVDTQTDEVSSEACTCSFYVIETQYTSHYAVFPPELVVPCVQAMGPQKVCLTCGEPARRIVDVAQLDTGRTTNGPQSIDRKHIGGGSAGFSTRTISERTDAGWTDCGHDNWRPGLVLDPFAGSGTTLAVATGHGLDAIGIDIDHRNAALAADRVGPLLMQTEQLEPKR